jgi:hypothetical protein
LKENQTMNKVVLDPAMQARLNGFNEHLELCDETRQVLGHFLPREMYRHLLVSFAKSVVTDEELERRRNEPGGSSLQEIWERLGNT